MKTDSLLQKMNEERAVVRQNIKYAIIILLVLIIAVLVIVLVKDRAGGQTPLPTNTPGGAASFSPSATVSTPSETPSAGPAETPAPATPKPSNPYGDTTVSSDYYGKKLIAFTFDDGPRTVYTAHLLDELKKRNVPVTFFVNGKNFSPPITDPANVAVLQRMIAEGHEIGNHTYEHTSLKSLSAEKVQEALFSLNEKVEELIGYKMHLFRPPGGAYNTNTLEAATNMTAVMWSVDSEDWKYVSDANIKKYAEAEGISQEEAKSILVKQVADNVIRQAKNGSIVLFHDVHPSSADAALLVIDELLKQDFVFLTVSDLILAENDSIAVNAVYGNMWGR